MEEQDIQRIAHLNEIVVSDWPAAEDYSYKVTIEVSSLFSRDVFRKELQARTVPAWMLNIRQDPQSKVELILHFRVSGSQEPWQEAGRATLQLSEALAANPSAANVTLPVTTWAQAPKLKLRVRLLSSLMLERTRGLRQIPHITSTRPTGFVRDLEHRVQDQSGEPARLPLAVSLTEPEEVIIKDTWNKLLAWKELAVPMFYRRLTHKAPELGELFESVGEGMAEQLFGLLDLCVRNLQPHTEHVLREAYRGVHPSPEFPCDTVEKYGLLFADMGMRPAHWRIFRDSLLWILPSVPYIEEYELGNFELGKDSAWYRFLNGHVVTPMLKTLQVEDARLGAQGLQSVEGLWSQSDEQNRKVGLEFLYQLFQDSPESLRHFQQVDIDRMAKSSFGSLESSLSGLNDWRRLTGATEATPDAFFESPQPEASSALKSALNQSVGSFSPELEAAWDAVAGRSKTVWEQANRRDHRMLRKASEYVEKVAKELGWDLQDLEGRLHEIGEEIAACGTYTHTYEEACYGAQMAWRNASKCVGRLAWKQLMIRDLRHVNHPDDMFEEIKEHLRAANNGGKVNPTVSLFRPMRPGEAWGPRIWNPQIIRYAAYRLSDGKIMGDPANLALTEAIMKLGWTPSHPRTPWDILPLVIEVPGMQPSLYELPKDLVLEVPIKHPKYEQFAHLGLRWYVIPAIANFRLEVGGISYGCCPFNGWYLVTEVARDFCDDYRYDKLEEIAKTLDLDTGSLQTMWRDEAFLETNKAILHSFQKNKMTIVDHHSASRQFLTHDLREKKAGRECPGQWSWVVPPLGGTTCPVYHHEMRDFFLEPQYYYHADKWAVETESAFEESSWLAAEMTDESVQIKVLHASEDDSAEFYARMIGRRLRVFQPAIHEGSQFAAEDLSTDPTVLLLVVSAIESGELPAGAKRLIEELSQKTDGELDRMVFGLLVLGDSVHGHFVHAADPLVAELSRIGGRKMLPVKKADRLQGESAAFDQWLSLVCRMMGEDPTGASAEQEAPERRLAIKEQAVGAVARPKPLRGRWVTVGGCDVIHQTDARQTRRLVIDTAGADFEYQVGDRMLIYPRHSDELVQRLCTRLRISPDTVLSASYMGVFGEELEDEPPFPSPMTVRDVMAGELSLTWTEPYPEMFRTLIANCSDAAESARLRDVLLAVERGDLEHKQHVRRQLVSLYPTVVHLLEAFPSVSIKVKTLVEILPKVRPIELIVCSSAELEPGKIRATFNLPVSGGVPEASYLAGLKAGDAARVEVRASRFRLPTDTSAPLLLAAEGIGLGVVTGFLSEVATKAQLGTTSPPMHLLVIGDSAPYTEQLEAWASRGVLTDLVIAADVGSGLQDLAKAVTSWGDAPNGHVYFSGETLVSDAFDDGLLALWQQQGARTYSQAVDLLHQLEDSGRFHRSLVTLTPGQTSIEQVRLAKYSQGERWMRRYKPNEAVETVAAGG